MDTPFRRPDHRAMGAAAGAGRCGRSPVAALPRAAPGAGLAAPQIGVPLRVFVWDIDEELGHLINPTLDLSADLQEGEEGCLSFPELRYETPRAFRAVAKGFNMHGEPVTVEGTELLARCLQHESDHLDGVLFIDRLPESERKLAMKEIRESEWFGLSVEHQAT